MSAEVLSSSTSSLEETQEEGPSKSSAFDMRPVESIEDEDDIDDVIEEEYVEEEIVSLDDDEDATTIEEEISVEEVEMIDENSYIEEEIIEEEIIVDSGDNDAVQERQQKQMIVDKHGDDDNGAAFEIEEIFDDPHFHNQKTHFFDNSQLILRCYNEDVLDDVYDTTFVNDEQQGARQGATIKQFIDYSDDDEDSIARELARIKEEASPQQSRSSKRSNAKAPVATVENKTHIIEDTKMFSKRKYKSRKDPYMGELVETISKWFFCNAESNKDIVRTVTEMGGTDQDERLVANRSNTEALVDLYDFDGEQAVESAGIEEIEYDGLKESTKKTDAQRNEEKQGDSIAMDESLDSIESHSSFLLDSHSEINSNDELDESIAREDMEEEILSQEDKNRSRNGNDTTAEESFPSISSSTLADSINKMEEVEKALAARTSDSAIPLNNEVMSVLADQAVTAEKVLWDDLGKEDPIYPQNLGSVVQNETGASTSQTTNASKESSKVFEDIAKERSILDHDECCSDASSGNIIEQEVSSTLKQPESSEQQCSTEFETTDFPTYEETDTGLSSFQVEYQSEERSVLHDFLKQKDWGGMTECLHILKLEKDFIIQQELTRLDNKREATPLHIAVAKAPIQLTTLLVSLIPFNFREDILTATDRDGNTPLHIACENLEAKQGSKSYASVIKILTLGAPRAYCMRNYHGDSPLFLLLTSPAMRAENARKVNENMVGDENVEKVAAQLVKSILNGNESLIYDRNDDGKTLLHAAAANCVHEKVLEILLSTLNGLSLAEVADQHEMLPLHYLSSCTSGRIPSSNSATMLVEAFPESVLHVNSTGDTPLHLLVSNIASWIKDQNNLNSSDSADLVRVLLGDELSASGSPLLVKNADSFSPLHCCVLFDTPLNIVSTMMESACSVDATICQDSRLSTPLHSICSSPEIAEKVKLIEIIGTREASVTTDDEGNTPLLLAVANPNATKVVIGALGAINPEAARIENTKGRTPFQVAIRNQADESIVKAVIKVYPKAVKVVFKGNNNIFHEMCQYDTGSGIISGLLQVYPEGAMMQNDRGNVPLHVASAYSLSHKIIGALIRAYPEGCMVQNKMKELPLHYAAGEEAAKLETVKLLIQASPESILVKDKKGRTPLDRAKEVEVDIEVYEVLRRCYKQQHKEASTREGFDSPKSRSSRSKSPKPRSPRSKSPRSNKAKKKKIRKDDFNESIASMDLNDVHKEKFSGSHNVLDESLGSTRRSGRSKKKKDKIDSAESSDSVALYGSMNLNDVHPEQLNESRGGLENSNPVSTGKVKKKKKKDKGDRHDSVKSIGDTGDSVLATPSKKKKSSRDIGAGLKSPKGKKSHDSHAVNDSMKSPSKHGGRKKASSKDPDGLEHGAETPKSSKRLKDYSTRKVKEEDNGLSMETPKARKKRVSSEKGDKTPKTPKTPKTSKSSTRRLKKDRSELDESTTSIDVENDKHSKTPKSSKSSARRSVRKSKKKSSNDDTETMEAFKNRSLAPTLPDLMTPSHTQKTIKSTLVDDILSSPQVWKDEHEVRKKLEP